MNKHFKFTNGRSSNLSDGEIEDLKTGTWQIDCPRIEIRCRGKDSITYSGPGSLRQVDGQITYKIYDQGNHNLKTQRDKNTRSAGTLIPEDQYCDLFAIDLSGRSWESKRFLPGTAYCGNVQEQTIEGRVRTISCEGEIPDEITVKGCTIDFIVFEKIKIPENSKISEHRHVAGWSWSHHYGSNAWKFRAAKFRFLFTNDRNDRLRIYVATDEKRFPKHMERRVLETSLFVLGQPLYPTITLRRFGHRTETTLYSSHRPLIGVRHLPPLLIGFRTNPKTKKLTAEPYRKLFERFLSYVLSSSKYQHPLWAQLNAVYEASGGMFVDSQALTLTVAIESLLDSEFRDIAKPDDGTLEEVDKAIKYMKGWLGNPRMKERVIGSMRMLKSSRAEDKLRYLIDKGAISPEALQAWKKLRNPSAHKYQNNSLDAEKFNELIGINRTLFYQLIFHAIRYYGIYNDYGYSGWPTKQYPPPKAESSE